MPDPLMKILYVAGLTPNDSSQYRSWALQRLGHTVVEVNFFPYEPGSPLVRKVMHRVIAGPAVNRFNRDILAAAERERPDVFWADKLLWLQPRTLRRLRAMGIATVSYMIDNPFGLRGDPGWRLYMQCIPEFDLHVTQRDRNLIDYRERGARDVMKVQTAYEPTVHFPPPAGWSEADRTREVSFIGTPYDRRAEFLTRLWRESGVDVSVNGGLVWKPALGPEAAAAIYKGHGEIYGQAYRETVWRSRINLSFLTHSNQDEFVHKSFEIAACGGFLLAERSEGHLQRFVEGEEAIFFADIEECVAKIRRYLPDAAVRERIALAGRLRAERSGYGNDVQMKLIVERVRMIPQARSPGA